MKKLAIICVLIFFAYSPLQAQLKILNQNQINIHKPSSESEKYFVLEVKEKGFLLCEIVKDAVNNKSASNTKVVKSEFVGNNIKYLDNGTFLVWGMDEDNTKGKTVNMNFKIVELK